MAFFSKLFGGESSALDKYSKELALVNGFKEEIAALTEDEIKKEITNFRNELSSYAEASEDLWLRLREIAPRVFALVREASTRTIKQTHFDVQIIGGFALANSK